MPGGLINVGQNTNIDDDNVDDVGDDNYLAVMGFQLYKYSGTTSFTFSSIYMFLAV